MDFCRRAQNALERGEPARALMILVRGLRRHPDNEEALDQLLFVYTRHFGEPGLETELIRGLEFHEHRPAMLRLAIDELRRVEKHEMARALEGEADDRGVAVASPDVLQPEDHQGDDDRESDVSLEDSGAVEVLSKAGLETGEQAVLERDDGPDGGLSGAENERSDPDTEYEQGERNDTERPGGDDASSTDRLALVAGAAVGVVVVVSIVFVGWQHARDVRQMIAVDEALVALDPLDPKPVRQMLDETGGLAGDGEQLRERERFVDAVVALETGVQSGRPEPDETPETSWGLAAAALEAAQLEQWEEAMRFAHHLEHTHGETLPAYFTRGRICELRRDWECARARYGRVQHHFEEFVAARTAMMRIGAQRYEADRWRRERSQLSDRRPDHPYAEAPWIDVFAEGGENFDDGLWRRATGDVFLDEWRQLARMVETRRAGRWDELRQKCRAPRTDEAPRIPARAVLCGQAAAEDGDVQRAYDHLETAATQRGLSTQFYRRIQTTAPRMLADLGRSDLGLSLTVPFDDEPLEETGSGDESAGGEAIEVPAHFLPPGDQLDDLEARALLVRGQVWIDHGATRRARRTLAPLMTRDDLGDRARFELTRSHLVEGNRQSALRSINQIGDDALEAGARAYLAHLEGRHGDAWASGPGENTDPRLVRVRALAYLADGRGRDAMSLLADSDRGLERLVLRPVQLRAFARAGEDAAVEDRRSRFPEFEEATTIDVLVDGAGAAFWYRDLESSGRWLQRVLERVPGHPEASWKAGLVRRAEGDERGSRYHFGRAWRGDENSPQWLVESGQVHLDAGRYEEARETFLSAALRERENVDAVRGLGRAYLEGDPERGRRDLAELLDNYGSSAAEQPARAEMKRWLAILHGSREGDQKARTLLEQAREVGGDRWPILIELGRYYGANDQWEQAREHFGTALRVDPTVPEVHLGLARAARAVGEAERAGEHYRRLADMVPVGELHERAQAGLEQLEENVE